MVFFRSDVVLLCFLIDKSYVIEKLQRHVVPGDPPILPADTGPHCRVWLGVRMIYAACTEMKLISSTFVV